MEVDSDATANNSTGGVSGASETPPKPSSLNNLMGEGNGENSSSLDKAGVMVVLNFLKKNNLKTTEEWLRKEANITDSEVKLLPSDSDVHSVLSSYASDENPDQYSFAYNQLKCVVDSSLDAYKFELGQVLWPVFVHMYLELVYNNHETQAAAFFSRYSKIQETFHDDDIISLGSIMKRQHLLNSENPFRLLSPSSGGKTAGTGSVYVVRMSREALSILKRSLQEKKLKIVQNIIQDRIFIEVYDGIPRGKAAVHATGGHIMGEALRQENKAKVYYGLLKEPDLQNFQVDEDEDDQAGGSVETGKPTDAQKSEGSASGTPSEKSKKKKSKKDWLSSKKSKNDPNAPPITRMPLPELRDIDKIEKAKALRDSAKRVTLGPDRLPSICFYTILNGDNQVTCIRWSEDGVLIAIGFATSLIRIWSLTPGKLKKLKAASDLADIDREADDVLVRMMDDRSEETSRCLKGHSGPIYSVDFSPDKIMLLSSSEDASIRLWSLLTWTCLVVYKGHLFPVWKTVFSPHGYYFASAGHDRTARLWATDTPQPLRVFAGHYSDVTGVVFHPNSNYVATGSSDRGVRLWDCVSGACVRLMTGHKGTVQSLCFSMDGRFLVSGGSDSKIIIWDMANGGLVTCLHSHTGHVFSLAFSREGNVLATGGLDSCVRIWDFVKITEDVISEEGGATISPDVKKISGDGFLVGEFPTKSTPIFGLHFTRRNILLASGPFTH